MATTQDAEAQPETLPAVVETTGLRAATNNPYAQWKPARGVSWLVQAEYSLREGYWFVRVGTGPSQLRPAEAYRLAEYVTRAAAYCEAQERERERPRQTTPAAQAKQETD